MMRERVNIVAVACAAFVASLSLPEAVSANDFNFYGIKFGMTKKEVQEAVNRMASDASGKRKLYKSTGGQWGQYLVDSPGHKILSIYFKFNKAGKLYWMKIHYPYSLTNPGQTRPLLDSLKEHFVKPVRQRHKDIDLTFDERRMRMTLVSKTISNN